MMPLGSSNDRDGHLRNALRSGGMLLLFVLFAMLTACAAPPGETMATMTVTPTRTPTPKPTSTPMPSPTPWPGLGEVMGVKAGGHRGMITEHFSTQFEKMVGGNTVLTGTEQTVEGWQQEASKWGLRLVVGQDGEKYVVGFTTSEGVVFPYPLSSLNLPDGSTEDLSGWQDRMVHYDGANGDNVRGIEGLPEGWSVVAVVVDNPLASSGVYGTLRYAVFDDRGELVAVVDPFARDGESEVIHWGARAGYGWEESIPSLAELAQAQEGKDLLTDLAIRYPNLPVAVVDKSEGKVRVKVEDKVVEGYVRRWGQVVWVERRGGGKVVPMAWLDGGKFVAVKGQVVEGRVVYEMGGEKYVVGEEGVVKMVPKEMEKVVEEIRAMENREWGVVKNGQYIDIVKLPSDEKLQDWIKGKVVITSEKDDNGDWIVMNLDEVLQENKKRKAEGKKLLYYTSLDPDTSQVPISDKNEYGWQEDKVVYGGKTVMRAGQNEAEEWGWWIPTGEGETWVAKDKVVVSYVKVDDGWDNVEHGLKNERVVVRVEVKDKAPAVVGDKEWVRWVYQEGEWYEVPEPEAVVALAEDMERDGDVMEAMENALGRLPSLEEAEVVPRAILDIYLRQQAEVWRGVKDDFEVWANSGDEEHTEWQGVWHNSLEPIGEGGWAIAKDLVVLSQRIIVVSMVKVGQEEVVMSMPMMMKANGGETRVKWFNFFVDVKDNDMWVGVVNGYQEEDPVLYFEEAWEKLKNKEMGNGDQESNPVDIYWVLQRGYEGQKAGWGDGLERLVVENALEMQRMREKDGKIKVVDC